MPICVAAFYRFVTIADCLGLQAQLRDACASRAIVGTVLIAPEGINATIAGGATEIGNFLDDLQADQRFARLDIKFSICADVPFRRLKVKIKPEIVTFGAPDARPAQRTGTRIAPLDWNAFIADPDVMLIDTRNAFEVTAGSFPSAIDPQTKSFSEFPAFAQARLGELKQKKVAMFCTGGIRCEKASAYLLGLGISEVYQLDGGILNYLEVVPGEQSRWRGECVVFDERLTVDQDLRKGAATPCALCGNPVTGPVACPHCASL
jgi:UPF0176 protein